MYYDSLDNYRYMFRLETQTRKSLGALAVTSAVSTLIFAMIYGVIEHTLLTSPLGIGILEYPLSLHLGGQLYFYHILLFLLAVLISFNPFFDVILFGKRGSLRSQALFCGAGNILTFIWVEDVSYFTLFGEWPKDIMTPLHLSIYGVVWWYPVLFGLAGVCYYLMIQRGRRHDPRDDQDTR